MQNDVKNSFSHDSNPQSADPNSLNSNPRPVDPKASVYKASNLYSGSES